MGDLSKLGGGGGLPINMFAPFFTRGDKGFEDQNGGYWLPTGIYEDNLSKYPLARKSMISIIDTGNTLTIPTGYGMCWDGECICVLSTSKLIKRYNPDGTLNPISVTLGGPATVPKGFAWDSDLRRWMVLDGGQFLHRYNTDGTYITATQMPNAANGFDYYGNGNIVSGHFDYSVYRNLETNLGSNASNGLMPASSDVVNEIAMADGHKIALCIAKNLVTVTDEKNVRVSEDTILAGAKYLTYDGVHILIATSSAIHRFLPTYVTGITRVILEKDTGFHMCIKVA